MIDFKNIRRIGVKIGSNILTTDQNQLDLNLLRHLVEQIVWMRKQNKELIIVTSGAIVCGSEALGGIQPQDISEKQAAAAVGQVILMENYQQFFARKGCIVGQVLVTRDAFMDKKRAQLACNTFEKLLSMSIIPIVNENDTVSVEEIRFSDNDNLAALVAEMLNVDLQIFLTDIDGVYNADPRVDKNATLMPQLSCITDEMIQQMGAASQKGRGGMQSKVTAARQLMDKGISVIIANGRRPQILSELFNGTPPATFCLGEKK